MTLSEKALKNSNDQNSLKYIYQYIHERSCEGKTHFMVDSILGDEIIENLKKEDFKIFEEGHRTFIYWGRK